MKVYFFIKITLSALIIAGISELGERSSLFAALLASLPLTSILAMIWLYRETGDVQKVIGLSQGIFWVVVPSLLFFVVLPLLLKSGLKFYVAMILSCLIMFAGYSLYLLLLDKIGIKI